MTLTMIGNIVLYVWFALFSGFLLLYTLPSEKRPSFNVSKYRLSGWVWCLPAFSFFSIFDVYRAQRGLDTHVLQWREFISWNVGQSWLLTLLLSIVLFIVLRTRTSNITMQRSFQILALLILVLLFIADSWVSHPASMEGWQGMVAHGAHFMAVSLWIGVLLVIGFFSKTPASWLPFLKWYTPMAIICIGVILGSGMFMIPMVTTSYIGALGMTYGQALLIKHILFIGVLVYGVVNGILMRRRLYREPLFQPTSWWKAEGLLVLLVFGATGYLSVQPPPHDVSLSVHFLESSLIFQWFSQIGSDQVAAVSWVPTVNGSLFLVAGLLLLAIFLLSFRSNMKAAVSFVVMILAVANIYSGMMLSLEMTELTQLSESTRRIVEALGSSAYCH